MSIHLLIIAKHTPDDREMEQAAALAQETENFRVRRCPSPSELIPTVREVVAITKQKIDVLDLYGHGSPGRQRMGREILFDRDRTGLDIAEALRPFLTADARVRLLGCRTGLYEEGRTLLKSLHAAFGGTAIVQGTLKRVLSRRDIDAGGFLPDREDMWLFSSTDAQRREAPSEPARIRELRAWYESVTASSSLHNAPPP